MSNTVSLLSRQGVMFNKTLIKRLTANVRFSRLITTLKEKSSKTTLTQSRLTWILQSKAPSEVGPLCLEITGLEHGSCPWAGVRDFCFCIKNMGFYQTLRESFNVCLIAFSAGGHINKMLIKRQIANIRLARPINIMK